MKENEKHKDFTQEQKNFGDMGENCVGNNLCNGKHSEELRGKMKEYES